MLALSMRLTSGKHFLCECHTQKLPDDIEAIYDLNKKAAHDEMAKAFEHITTSRARKELMIKTLLDEYSNGDFDFTSLRNHLLVKKGLPTNLVRTYERAFYKAAGEEGLT